MIAVIDGTSSLELLLLFIYAIGSALVVGFVAPLYGVVLLVRGTSFQGIALPQAAACGVAFGFAAKPLFGSEEAHAALHQPSLGLQLVSALVFTFLGVAIIGRRPKPGANANARVAGVFAASSALTVLFAHASPEGEIFVHDLLHGEILALGPLQFVLLFLSFAFLFVLFLVKRRPFALLSFDREAASVQGLPVRALEGSIALATGLLIAMGTMTVGPMILFGLLVLPPLSARPFARSMESFYWISTLFGTLAAAGGIALSFRLDEPFGPSIVAVSTLLLLPGWLLSKWRPAN